MKVNGIDRKEGLSLCHERGSRRPESQPDHTPEIELADKSVVTKLLPEPIA